MARDGEAEVRHNKGEAGEPINFEYLLVNQILKSLNFNFKNTLRARAGVYILQFGPSKNKKFANMLHHLHMRHPHK